MAEITPLFLFDFQKNLNLRFSNSWSTTLGKLWWQTLAITQSSGALEELYEWMLETAAIRPTGSKGTELDFEDLVAISYRIVNDNFGTGLKLSRNSIEDNKYDRAAKWAADVGSAGAYWPQRQITKLIQAGKTKPGYDGRPFFSVDHPVNPFDDAAGVYSNLFTGMPLNPANIAKAYAEIVAIRHPGDAPRYLEPEVLVVDPSNKLAATQAVAAEIITDPLNQTQGAPATNIIKRTYGLGEPIVVPEFSNEKGVWYLGCRANEDAFSGAFIYQERKAFELTSYTGATLAELDRLMEFEWHLKGRNTCAYGHPYLFYRIEP